MQFSKEAPAAVTEGDPHVRSEATAGTAHPSVRRIPAPPRVAMPAVGAATAIELAQAAAKAATDSLIAERAAWEEEPGPAEAEFLAFSWAKHSGKSCQGLVEETGAERTLEESKALCGKTERCAAVMCLHDDERRCTLRQSANLLAFAPEDCFLPVDDYELSPLVNSLVGKGLCFRGVHNQRGRRVNIVIVQRPPDKQELNYIEKYKNEILFLAISSFEDWPLDSMNPFSQRISRDRYRSIFQGFCIL